MKKLPPSNGNKPVKSKSNGSTALASVDYFLRFKHLTEVYDEQVKAYGELRDARGSFLVRYLMEQLSPVSEEVVGDSLQKLWPSEADIFAPSHRFYVVRLGLLVNSFPSAAPHAPADFTRMLVSCIAVKAPSCMVLESACFELTNSYKYSNMPAIGDLMVLVDKHEPLWEKRLRIDHEIRSGRARKKAEGRLAYEEEEEQKKIKWTIARLEKLNQPGMISELNEHGIDALDEEFEDKVRKLENEAQEQARIAEQKRKEADPKYKAIVAFLSQFKLYEWHHDELVEDLYKRDITAEAIATIANGNGISPDTLRDINAGLAHNYMPTRDFIKSATFKTLHLKEPKVRRNEWWADDDDEEQNRRGARIRF
jgi:hypothetical protein